MKLEDIIQALEADPRTFVRVDALGTFGKYTPIVMMANKDDLQANYGGSAEFFNKLFSDGVRKVKVSPRKRNGTSSVPLAPPVEIMLQDKPNPIAPPANPAPQPVASSPGLQGAKALVPAPVTYDAVPFGLQGSDVAYKYHDHNRLVQENIRLQAENDRLRDTVYEQKERILENKFSTEKAKSNNDLIKGLGEILTPIVVSKMGAGAQTVPGLAGQNLSPLKTHLVNVVTHLDEGFANDLVQVLTLWGQSEEFDKEITELITKHQNGTN